MDLLCNMSSPHTIGTPLDEDIAQLSPSSETILGSPTKCTQLRSYALSRDHKAFLIDGSLTSIDPGMTTPPTRLQYLGRKLAFWRKKETTAVEVHKRFKALVKSHEAYTSALKAAHEALNDWSEYLAPHAKLANNLQQYETMNPEFGAWMQKVLKCMSPVIETEKPLHEIYVGLAHTFDLTRREEETVELSIRRLSYAERKYFKSMASEMSGGERTNRDNDRIRLGAAVVEASKQFHLILEKSVPQRFDQLFFYYSSLQRRARFAAESLNDLMSSKKRLPREFIERYSASSPSHDQFSRVDCSRRSSPGLRSIGGESKETTAFDENFSEAYSERSAAHSPQTPNPDTCSDTHFDATEPPPANGVTPYSPSDSGVWSMRLSDPIS